MQQVKGEEHELAGVAFGERRLQRGEIRRAVRVERHDLAIDDPVRQPGAGAGDGAEPAGPVQPLARAQDGTAAFDAELNAVAVELDLVQPTLAGRRTLDGLAELRLDELGHGGRCRGLGGRCRGLGGRRRGVRLGARRLALRPQRGRQAGGGVPYRILGDGTRPGHHERRRRPARAGGDLGHGPPGGDGPVLRQQRVSVTLAGMLVTVLDQQPVHTLAGPALHPALAPNCRAGGRPPA